MAEVDNCIPLYRDAVACLAITAKECAKSANIDITSMLSNIARAAELVQELRSRDLDPTRQDAMEQLQHMLSYQQFTLEAKIKELDNGASIGRLDLSVDSPPGWPGDAQNAYVDVAQRSDDPSAPTQYSDSSREQEGGDDVQSQKRRRRLAIQDTVVKERNLSFSDVAGLHQAKEALKEAIVMPLLYPHLFTGGRKPWRRILLYGPPGTGKSRLAQSLASEISYTFYCVSSSDLLSSWVGESEKLIKELFQHATSHEGKSVIFIDELDSLCRRRSSGEEEHTRRVKTELLHQMEGAMNTSSAEQVFLLAATNCPWELDPGFLRRFQKRIYIPLPDRDARKTLIKLHLKGTVADMSDEDWDELITKTDGYSGSDLSNLVLGALFEPIRELQRAQFWSHTPDGKLVPCKKTEHGAFKAEMSALPREQVIPRDMGLQDFLASLDQHRNTVTTTDLERFDEFTKNFGQNG